MLYPEFIELCKWTFKKKGDHLNISLTTNPKRYFKNFREIFFKSELSNNAIEEETEEDEETEKEGC